MTTHQRHQQYVIQETTINPKHVAVFHKNNDGPISLIHYETNRGAGRPDKVHDIWTMWNRGSYFVIVDCKEQDVYGTQHSGRRISTNYDMCLGWLVDKSVEINNLNKEI